MIENQFKFGLCLEQQSSIDQVVRLMSEWDIELEISRTSLDYAIPDVRRMEAEGVEVILTNTSTGTVLLEHVDIPVVMFKIKPIDFMVYFIEAAKQGKRLLVPMLYNTTSRLYSLEEITGVKFDQVAYHDAKSARRCLDSAKELGYEIVIGGGYTNLYAEQIGLRTIDFRYSDDTIREAIRTAISIGNSNRAAKAISHRYRTILDTTSDGVIATDESGKITEINRAACQLLDIDRNQTLGKSISDIMPGSTVLEVMHDNRPIGDSIEKIKGKSFVWNHQPFEVLDKVAGCVSTFSEAASVMRTENKIRRTLSKGHVARYQIADLLYQSDVMKKTINHARQFAKTDSNLLVMGETGTGKEILVQGVHNLSHRRKYPFVSLNCAALPDQLLESELFGYEEGAFTGSRKGGKTGLFELAHKGTIFLDEIGETSEHVQIRLLRVLQEREIMRLGDDRLISIDVRVIAASNRDLAKEVRLGKFRRDLFYRLNILVIKIPPLRERLDDIPLLLEEFVSFYSKQHGIKPLYIPARCIEQLQMCRWSGNVRQLQNFTERLVLLSHSRFDPAVFESIYGDLIEGSTESGFEAASPIKGSIRPADPIKTEKMETENNLETRIDRLRKEKEKQIMKEALAGTNYNIGKTADVLGISRTTLWRRMKEAGLK